MRLKDDSKRIAICNAAIKLINEMGFAEASMSKIAKEANVSPATIYVYFTNKEDLLNKLYLMVKQVMSNELTKGLGDTTSIKSAFELIWHNHYQYLLNYPSHLAFAEQFANSPLIARLNREESYTYLQAIFELFNQGKQENIFKEVPNEILIAYGFFPLLQLAKSHLAETFTLDRETLNKAFEIAWDSITI